jgi:hypothetical protein
MIRYGMNFTNEWYIKVGRVFYLQERREREQFLNIELYAIDDQAYDKQEYMQMLSKASMMSRVL